MISIFRYGAPNGHGPCPSAETLSAFLDGGLSAEERGAVIRHLAHCTACYLIFRESLRNLWWDREK
jgi:Putative zinc-finger